MGKPAQVLTWFAAGERGRTAWAAAVLSLAATLGLALYLAVSGHDVDADVYLMGGRHVFGPDLYSVQLGKSGLLFTYPPLAAFLFAPLAYGLTLIPAQAVWAVVNVAALLWLLTASIRVARPSLERAVIWRWALALSFPALLLDPVYLTVGLGQVNLLLVAAVCRDLVGPPEGRRRRLPAGVAIGLAAAVKLTPLLFVPYLLLTRRLRAAGTALATFVLAGLVMFAVTPSSSWAYWRHDALDTSRVGGLLYNSNQDLAAALQRFHHGAVPAAVLWPALAVVGLGGLALAALASRRSSELLGAVVCGGIGLVVSPVTWAHHMVWIVPAVVWLAVAADRPRRGTLWAATGVLLFWASPIWWVPRSWRPGGGLLTLHEKGWQLVAGNAFFLAVMAFEISIAVMLWARLRRDEPLTGRSGVRLLPVRNSA